MGPATPKELEPLIAQFDVANPGFIANPYPVLGALREATPIFWSETTNRWMLTRFADVAETLRDRRLGRSYSHLYSNEHLGRPEPDPRWNSFHQHERWSLLSLEPPDHTRLRRLVSKVFTPRAVAALHPTIEGFSESLLNSCEDLGTFDLLADYAQPYSVAVICSMLGVPQSDTQNLLGWSHAIVKMYELSATDETKELANQAAANFIAYTTDLIDQKRRSPDGLLISQLVEVEDAGDTLSEAEIVSTAMVLLEAGHEATVNTLGNGMLALMKHPNQWQRLVRGEVGGKTAAEELLRFDSPLQMFERWVLEPGVEIAGQPMQIGDEVAMLFGSAQRDPRRFANPDDFDVGRNDPTHIGFGGGLHFCVGAPLARQELAVSIDGLAARFPKLGLAEEPAYHPTFVIRGLQRLLLASKG